MPIYVSTCKAFFMFDIIAIETRKLIFSGNDLIVFDFKIFEETNSSFQAMNPTLNIIARTY